MACWQQHPLFTDTAGNIFHSHIISVLKSLYFIGCQVFFCFNVFRCIHHTDVFHPNLSILNLEKIKDTLKCSEFTQKAISPTPTYLPSNCYVDNTVRLQVQVDSEDAGELTSANLVIFRLK